MLSHTTTCSSLPIMSGTDPFVDWAVDPDVTQLGKVTDAQALKEGWSNAKVTGALCILEFLVKLYYNSYLCSI